MKQFILSLLILYSVLTATLFPLTVPTRAQATQSVSYACILDENAYLYATSNERSGLFLLPKTYYVKVLSVQGDFAKVEYSTDGEHTKKLTGYCKTAQLTFVDYIPSKPYFYSTFELTYRIDDSDKRYPFLTEITVTCAYYGEYPIGSEIYCYVLQGDSFGYVPKPTELTVPVNTEYADRLTATTTPPEESEPIETKESLPIAQIVTIVLLCLIAPVLATLVLRPSRARPDFDEE